MKMINRITLIISLLFISLGLKAHQPDLSSTVLVEQGKNEWVLQIRAALTGFEYEIIQHYGASSYSTPEEFQELVLKHMKENISILFNEDDNVILENGLVRLGHETSVAFKVAGTPEDIHSMIVKNSGFSNISRNQSSLIVLKEGYAKDQFVMNNDNGHTVKLKVGDSKFALIAAAQAHTNYYFLIIAGIFLVLIIALWAFKHKQLSIITFADSNLIANNYEI